MMRGLTAGEGVPRTIPPLVGDEVLKDSPAVSPRGLVAGERDAAPASAVVREGEPSPPATSPWAGPDPKGGKK